MGVAVLKGVKRPALLTRLHLSKELGGFKGDTYGGIKGGALLVQNTANMTALQQERAR